MAVLGNTADGVPMAGITLTRDDLVARLAGNFAVLYTDQVVTTDTRLGISKESIIAQLPVAVTVTPLPETITPPTATAPIESRPSWILPVVGIVTVSLVGFLLLMLRKELSTRVPRSEGKLRGQGVVDSSAKDS